MKTAGVVLAAGGGSRYVGGSHKLLAPYAGQPLVATVLDAACAAAFDATAVVVGAVDLGELVPDGMTILENSRWSEGLSSSLAVAIAFARASGCDALVIGLGDMPGVPAAAWVAVGAVESGIAVASFDGALRPPVRLPRAAWDDVPTEGDIGARALWHRPGTTEVPCAGDPTDVDTREDLAKIVRAHASS